MGTTEKVNSMQEKANKPANDASICSSPLNTQITDILSTTQTKNNSGATAPECYAQLHLKRNHQNDSMISLKYSRPSGRTLPEEVRKMFGNLAWGTERIRTFSEHQRNKHGAPERSPWRPRKPPGAHLGPTWVPLGAHRPRQRAPPGPQNTSSDLKHEQRVLHERAGYTCSAQDVCTPDRNTRPGLSGATKS